MPAHNNGRQPNTIDMNAEDKIRTRYGKETGFRVPDGYFEHVYMQIESRLPETAPSAKPKPMSLWQRIKPYVYMAAMFGGIWCTMKMVNMVSESSKNEISLDNPPALVAKAMNDPDIAAQICPTSSTMVVEETYEPSAIDSAEPQENETTADAENSENTANEAETMSGYDEFVEVSDIDLNSLRAALDTDDSSDDYYYI